MGMTKQDFIALADTIRDHNTRKPGLRFKHYHINAIADFCRSRNPRFNRERWLGYIAGTNGPNGGSL